MGTLQSILSYVQMAMAVVVVALIMVQEGNEGGLGAISGGSDSFFSRNEGATRKVKMRKATGWLSLLFVALTVALYVMVSTGV